MIYQAAREWARRPILHRTCMGRQLGTGSGFREGLWHARRLPPFVAERPNLLSYLRRLRLRVASAAV